MAQKNVQGVLGAFTKVAAFPQMHWIYFTYSSDGRAQKTVWGEGELGTKRKTARMQDFS